MINVIVWFLISALMGSLGCLLKFPEEGISLRQSIISSFIGSFSIAAISHQLLGLGNLVEFSLISAHLAWSGALLGVYLADKKVLILRKSEKLINALSI